MATVSAITRTFLVGPVELPDPDPAMTEDQVLQHYSTMYPQLRNGKVEDQGFCNGQHRYVLKANDYKANG